MLLPDAADTLPRRACILARVGVLRPAPGSPNISFSFRFILPFLWVAWEVGEETAFVGLGEGVGVVVPLLAIT